MLRFFDTITPEGVSNALDNFQMFPDWRMLYVPMMQFYRVSMLRQPCSLGGAVSLELSRGPTLADPTGSACLILCATSLNEEV